MYPCECANPCVCTQQGCRGECSGCVVHNSRECYLHRSWYDQHLLKLHGAAAVCECLRACVCVRVCMRVCPWWLPRPLVLLYSSHCVLFSLRPVSSLCGPSISLNIPDFSSGLRAPEPIWGRLYLVGSGQESSYPHMHMANIVLWFSSLTVVPAVLNTNAWAESIFSPVANKTRP